MTANPPPEQRKFANEWDEIGYLYDKLLYWLYQREDKRQARRFTDRIEPLLAKADPNHEAIFGEECWSLVHECKGELRQAIEHRENEIRLIRRLHDLSRDTPQEAIALKDYGYDDLSDRLDLLATLYHDSGDLDKAIATLQESKQLSEEHGIKFDGEDLLQEYLSIAKKAAKNTGYLTITTSRDPSDPTKILVNGNGQANATVTVKLYAPGQSTPVATMYPVANGSGAYSCQFTGTNISLTYTITASSGGQEVYTLVPPSLSGVVADWPEPKSKAAASKAKLPLTVEGEGPKNQWVTIDVIEFANSANGQFAQPTKTKQKVVKVSKQGKFKHTFKDLDARYGYLVSVSFGSGTERKFVAPRSSKTKY